LPMKNTLLRRSIDYFFEEIDVRPKIVGEFEDSAMLKMMGKAGVGAFPVASAICKEVEEMYGVEMIAKIPNLTEKYYALSVERKVKHPAVLAISEVARRNLGSSKF